MPLPESAPAPRSQLSLLLEPLLEQHWAKSPFIFKLPESFKGLQSEWLLEVLKTGRHLLAQGQAADIALFDSQGLCLQGKTHSPRFNVGLDPWLPCEEHSTLTEYIAWLTAHERFQRFALFLESPNGLNPELWRKLHDFAAELLRFVPESKVDFHCDAWIGNYSHTPFGAHKDPLHNFMFMVEGERTMLVWPGDMPFEELNEQNATEFNLKAGDVLYWPESAWHQGFNRSGKNSVSVNLDYTVIEGKSWGNEAFLDGVAKLAGVIGNHTLSEMPGEIDYKQYRATMNQAAEMMAKQIHTPLFQMPVSEAWLRRKSAMGFRAACPTRCNEQPPATGKLYSNQHSPIIYSAEGKRLTVASNGHLQTFNSNPELISQLEALNQGQAFACNGTDSQVVSSELEKLKQFLWNTRGLTAV